MPVPVDFADAYLLDAAGDKLGVVRLRPVSSQGQHKPAPLVEATPEETRKWNEERIQLLENRRYEYRLLDVPAGLCLRAVEGVITQNGFNNLLGTIEPGSNVGLLVLEAVDAAGIVTGRAAVEVRSTKLNYRKQYRRMLEDITDFCADLLLQVKAPAYGLFQPDPDEQAQTTAQRYAFLKHLLSAREFRGAIVRILADPHTQPVVEEVRREISRGFRPDGRTLRQLATGTRRRDVPPGHPLAPRMATVPTHLIVRHQANTLDTAENRFVRHALESFDALLANMERTLTAKGGSSPSDRRLLEDVGTMRRELGGTLSDSLFREVSTPTTLDLGSPVLQRRAGYREVLRAWLRFSAAARLVWEGGLDVYGSGKRDVANLYEYWVYFQLLDAVTGAFSLPKPAAESLLDVTDDGFGLKLKAGKQLVIDGRGFVRNREMRIRFAYNRTFQGKRTEFSYPTPGSWTRIMRPDYTLSIWPAALSEREAEELELMTHLHFDAKYKLEASGNSSALFGADGERALGDEKDASRNGRASKRADLMTLHAYRDAIRRTEGAYVIYPGDVNRQWSSYHELLPGLGAFAVKPGDTAAGADVLKRFLRDAADQVGNRAATREQARYHLYDVNMPFVPQDVSLDYAETTPTGRRALPPRECMVLDCSPRSLAHATWIGGADRIDLPLVGIVDPRLFTATYLLLRYGQPGDPPVPYRITTREVVDESVIAGLGCPSTGSGSRLLLTLAPAPEFSTAAWQTVTGAPGNYRVATLADLLLG